MPTIHRITADNSDLLANIAEDVFDYEIDGQRLAAYLASPQQTLFVAVEEGLVIGQVRGFLLLQPDQGPDLYIDNLGVSPAWKRRGVATALAQALFKFGRERGCAGVWVATEADNAEGIAFYDALRLKRLPVAMFEGEL